MVGRKGGRVICCGRDIEGGKEGLSTEGGGIIYSRACHLKSCTTSALHDNSYTDRDRAEHAGQARKDRPIDSAARLNIT